MRGTEGISRVPMPEGKILKIEGRFFAFDKCIGKQGTSSLVYEGAELIHPDGRKKPIDEDGKALPGIHRKNLIIKEFYPMSEEAAFDITRGVDGALKAARPTKESPAYRDRREQFCAAEDNQLKLGNASRVSEIIPRLYFCGDYGDSRYLFSERHDGWSLDSDRKKCKTLEEKLQRAYRMGELVQEINESGYIIMDFKPENFFWTNVGDTLYLIDLDSVIPYKDKALLKDSRIYTNAAYRAPEVQYFTEKYKRSSGRERENLKQELPFLAINIFNLGQYLYFLLFGKVPGAIKPEAIKGIRDLLLDQYEELKAGELYKEILDIFAKCLSESTYERYSTAKTFVNKIDKIQTSLKFRRMVPRKKYTKENCNFLSYKLIEEFPLYDYGWSPDRKVLDVSIVGNHTMWESMFTTILSCAQMLDTTLNIRLVATDVREKWEKYAAPSERPDLLSTVSVSLNGEIINEYRDDNKVVSVRLANVCLYEVNDYLPENGNEYEAIAGILRELNSERVQCNYYILIEEIEQWNRRFAQMLAGMSERQAKIFVGYLRYDESQCVRGNRFVQVKPFGAAYLSENYLEEKKSNRIFEMGYNVHRMYHRMSNQWATDEEMRADYKSDRYNIEGSERAALNIYYKMKSIGLDAKKESAPFEWHDRVLSMDSGSGENVFDRILWLEHLSWTAFMVTHGHRGVRSTDELRDYLYEGANDWKNKEDKKHLVHPCICESSVGYHIKHEMWRKYPNLTQKEYQSLDELDRWSLEVYFEVRNKLEKKRDSAIRILQDIHDIIRQNRSSKVRSAQILLEEEFQKLESNFWKILDEQSLDAARIWRASLNDFISICKTTEIFKTELRKKCEELDRYMKPAIWFREQHDFKKADEAVLQAAPHILYGENAASDSKKQGLIIYKAESEEPWENIYSTIMMNPARLILIPARSSDSKCLKEKYSKLVRYLNLRTQVDVTPLNQLTRVRGTLLLDLTGTNSLRGRKILELPFMSQIHPFVALNMSCRPLDPKDMTILNLNRSVSLSVEQILMINGVEKKSRVGKDSVARLRPKQYQALWKWYRAVNDENVWKTFRNVLGRIRKENFKMLETKEITANAENFMTDRIEGKVFRDSGLLEVLLDLQNRYSCLEHVEYPRSEEYSQVKFLTKCGELAEQIQEAVKLTNDKFLSCKWSVVEQNGCIYLKNDTLYVDKVISEHRKLFGTIRGAVKGVNRKWPRINQSEKNRLRRKDGDAAETVSSEAGNFDEISEEAAVEKVFSVLPKKEQEMLFPGLSVTREREGVHLKFRYASASVRKVFERSGNLLQALIYHECRNAGIFDDICCSEEFKWRDGAAENEIDIIGTRNSRTYFISAKATPLYDEHRREIFEHSYNFGIQSRAILVCSHPSSRKDGDGYGNVQRIVERMNAGGDRKQYLLVLDDIEMTDEGKRNSRRKIRIAESIKKVIEETEGLYREMAEEC